MLWLSHLVIRHSGVDGSRVPFNLTGWQSGAPPATRSPREAFQLADRLARAAREGGHFAELARQYSEDPTTSERGGSLGGVVAGHWAAWPQLLDAVATLKPGDVSQVVETEYGYHVLYRRAAAAPAVVSGSHIVIAHVDAPWIALAARGPVPRRSREDARALASRIYEQARRAPGEFARLVAEYSEHRDAARGGDFGSWSTREVSGYPREIETLARLEVGEVAQPIDTVFGYQVILRTPNRPRATYAMTKIALRFDSSRPDSDPYSKSSVHEQAMQLAQQLRQDPAKFKSLQDEWCCREVLRVTEGREVPALEAALARLAPGQIAAEPVEDVDVEYMIPQRLELAALPPTPEPRFELPAGSIVRHP